MDQSLQADLDLDTIREENAKRWERIQELYNQLEEEPTPALMHPYLYDSVNTARRNKSATTSNLNDRLQIELDFLAQSRWVKETHDLARRIEEESSNVNEEENPSWGGDELAADVLRTYRSLLEMNHVQSAAIDRERERLESLTVFRDEMKEILEELVIATSQQQSSPQSTMQTPKNYDNDSSGNEGNNDVEAINSQLWSDLAYAASCIEDQIFSVQTEKDECRENGTSWTFQHLLFQLIASLLNSRMDQDHGGDDPTNGIANADSSPTTVSTFQGLSVGDLPIRMEHVEFLRNTGLVYSYRDDDDLISLVDYRSY